MVMPIYEYEHSGGAGAGCAGRFEVFQSMAEAPLEKCPACGKAVSRIISTVSVGSGGGLLSKSNLEAHGFTQYRKKGKGYYEKTAGAGPKAIAGD